jgi:hypothetical protein
MAQFRKPANATELRRRAQIDCARPKGHAGIKKRRSEEHRFEFAIIVWGRLLVDDRLTFGSQRATYVVRGIAAAGEVPDVEAARAIDVAARHFRNFALALEIRLLRVLSPLHGVVVVIGRAVVGKVSYRRDGARRSRAACRVDGGRVVAIVILIAKLEPALIEFDRTREGDRCTTEGYGREGLAAGRKFRNTDATAARAFLTLDEEVTLRIEGWRPGEMRAAIRRAGLGTSFVDDDGSFALATGCVLRDGEIALLIHAAADWLF